MMRALFALLILVGPIQGQWLPEEAQKKEKALWDTTGVPFPQGMKFYDLPIVSQRLVTVNEVPSHGIFSGAYGGSSNVNALYPWITPAGLNDSPKNQWRKVAGAVFPSRVHVFRQQIQVLNSLGYFQPQPGIKWSFPDGTVFAEMLIRTHSDGTEYPFEIRIREKQDGVWDHGVTYRPSEDLDELTFTDYETGPGKLSDFGYVSWFPVRTYWLKPGTGLPPLRRFVPSSRVVSAKDDDSYVPKNYVGNVTRCIVCHAQAGEPTTYGSTTIRGSDTILSWHPFTLRTLGTDNPPELDSRWPLVGNR